MGVGQLLVLVMGVLGAAVGGLVLGRVLARARAAQAIGVERERAVRAEGALAALQAELVVRRESAAEQGALSELLVPVRESLDGLRRASEEARVERSAAEADIAASLRTVQQHYASLESTTAQLAAALSRGQTRGQWGEMQLEGLLEHAGLLEGTHFTRQESRDGDGPSLRPDVIVRLAGGGEVMVDAKFPFDAYWSALGSSDPAERDRLMRKHATDVLARVRELAGRRYADADASLDFVVMFLPLESLLSASLEVDGLLLEKAFERRVVLATPTTMLALLRTITFGYQRQLMADNAEEVRRAGAEMLTRLGVLVEHLEGLRRGLDQAVRGYNSFVGSFDRQAMRQARRLSELGVDASRPLDAPDALRVELRESDPRALRELA
jgi:DNA recombination protein RmuC